MCGRNGSREKGSAESTISGGALAYSVGPGLELYHMEAGRGNLRAMEV